jgi:hypothetical protein
MGGITKWIEAHLTLCPRDGEVTAVIAPADLALTVESVPEVRMALDQHADAIVGLRAAEPIEALEPILGRHVSPPAGQSIPLITEVLHMLRPATLATYCRRGVLSILRARGFAIVKDDHQPAMEEEQQVFWPAEEIDFRIDRLAMVLRHGLDNADAFALTVDWLVAARTVPPRDAAQLLQLIECGLGEIAVCAGTVAG